MTKEDKQYPSHYTEPASTFVPGSIIGYRQLKIYLRANTVLSPIRVLSPMRSNHIWTPGENVAACDVISVSIEKMHCRRCQETLSNGDQSPLNYYPYPGVGVEPSSVVGQKVDMYCIHYNTVMKVTITDAKSDHRPPGKTHGCGFYAAYDYRLLKDAPGCGWMLDGYKMKAVAAVEAYGKIQLSELGFRAEKMKILGLAPPPWRKPSIFSSPRRYRWKSMDLPVGVADGWNSLKGEYKLYDDVTEMVEEFPPADLTALGVPAVECEEEEVGEMRERDVWL